MIKGNRRRKPKAKGMEETCLVYMSFAEKGKQLGACVVTVPLVGGGRHVHISAVQESLLQGCNPGGEVKSVVIHQDSADYDLFALVQNKLMPTADLKALFDVEVASRIKVAEKQSLGRMN